MKKYQLTYLDDTVEVEGSKAIFDTFEEALEQALGDYENAHAPDRVYLHFDPVFQMNDCRTSGATYDKTNETWSSLGSDRIRICQVDHPDEVNHEVLVPIHAVLGAIFNNTPDNRHRDLLIKIISEDLAGNGHEAAAAAIPALWNGYKSV